MTTKNVLRQVEIIIYKLKRQYGMQMYIRYRGSDDEYNLETGDITRDLDYISIRRGILLPKRTITEFSYDLSFIAASKNFTYGGLYEEGTRWVLIDSKDLPRTFTLNTEMSIVFDNRRYKIAEHDKVPESLPRGYAWLLRVTEISASDDDVVT